MMDRATSPPPPAASAPAGFADHLDFFPLRASRGRWLFRKVDFPQFSELVVRFAGICIALLLLPIGPTCFFFFEGFFHGAALENFFIFGAVLFSFFVDRGAHVHIACPFTRNSTRCADAWAPAVVIEVGVVSC